MGHPEIPGTPIEHLVVGELYSAYGQVKGLSGHVEDLRSKIGPNSQVDWALEGAVEKLTQAEGLLRNAVESIPSTQPDEL